MKRGLAFAKRNFIEMVRDPIIYIFCVGFPVVMIVLFNVINSFTNGATPVFEAPALIPGMVMFSFSFVMLLTCLLVSKDRTSAFLIRLYTSPMKSRDFLIGYTLPCLAVGIAQEIICLFVGWLVSCVTGGGYFGFGAAVLLAIEMLPTLLFFIFAGVFAGSVLNDKGAPGVASVFISASGILGGAWMPLDAMGGFETFCRFLPFYPSVYIGRVITGATHSITDYANPVAQKYVFDSVAQLGIVPIVLFLAVSVVLALVFFQRAAVSDQK